MKKFENKSVLITGGSTGMGRVTALGFANDGARVLITGRNEETLKASASEHENISYLMADVSNPSDVVKTIEHIKATLGHLDVLINNAGVALFAPLEATSLDDHFDKMFNINVRGLYEMTRLALPLLEKSKGVIISTTSGAAVRPMPNGAAYSASKAAVVALTKAWARELAPKGIRVNVVSPGPIDTPIYGKMGMPEEQVSEMLKGVVSQVPLGRVGSSDDIAKAFLYLASDDASFVTGAELMVDGGFTA